jgi:hypothetical protein
MDILMNPIIQMLDNENRKTRIKKKFFDENLVNSVYD